MKKLFTFLTVLLFTSILFAQIPQKMSFQSVVRNNSGNLVVNQAIGIKISILQGSSTGSVVYVETQTPTTNANGLVSIAIGGGAGFDTISWEIGPHYIKTEVDPSGGTNYNISGASELLSVPYALYSANGPAGKLSSGSAIGNTPYWNGSNWISNSSNIYNNGGNIGIGTSTPKARLDIAAGNNWDLVNGDGDFKIGDTVFSIKMGIALDGGGAGDAGIMQNGFPGSYNVLSLGAQGNKLLFINGATQNIGIGTDNPAAKLDVHGTFSVVDGTQGAGKVLTSDANGKASWTSSNTHYIGESYGGGIVFFVYDGGQHGLIAATSDQSAGIRWYGGSYTFTRARADGVGAGKVNTAIIIANQGPVDGVDFAATVCNEYSVTVGGVTYGDWYLPSKFELNLLFLQKNLVGGFGTTVYWSSTEFDGNGSWMQDFGSNGLIYFNKANIYSVRAIRTF